MFSLLQWVANESLFLYPPSSLRDESRPTFAGCSRQTVPCIEHHTCTVLFNGHVQFHELLVEETVKKVKKLARGPMTCERQSEGFKCDRLAPAVSREITGPHLFQLLKSVLLDSPEESRHLLPLQLSGLTLSECLPSLPSHLSSSSVVYISVLLRKHLQPTPCGHD